MTERLRIGVLCDGNHLSAWQAKALREVLKLNSAKIALLIFNGEPPTAPEPVHAKLKRNIANDILIWRIYERLVLNKKVSATHEVEFPKELQDVPRLTVIPVRHGKFRRSLAVENLDALRRQNLDVLIRFGFGILTGEILNVARYGIWSFHHGDPQEFRGAPPGFWEIHNRATVTGVVLQRLTEKLDGGIVLRSGSRPSRRTTPSLSIEFSLAQRISSPRRSTICIATLRPSSAARLSNRKRRSIATRIAKPCSVSSSTAQRPG
jgi:hypothetical protein